MKDGAGAAGKASRDPATTLSKPRWERLSARLGLADTEATFRELARRYAQWHRHYHTAVHINDCLAKLDRSAQSEARAPLLEFALWFHDAVYNPFSSRNEVRSSAWATTVLRAAGIPDGACQQVHELIMATRHEARPVDAAQALLVDIDLSILGSDATRFDRFERQIRKEYWWVPGPRYRERRAAVLRSFLHRPTIYTSTEFRALYEDRARSNIHRLLARLANRSGMVRSDS